MARDQEHRYVVTIDAYVWAENDEQARAIADLYAKYLDCYEGYEDNKAAVVGLGEQPIGTLKYREINV